MDKKFIIEKMNIQGVFDKNILEAFESVPREKFLIDELKRYAYIDSPLYIGYGQTISQPSIVLHMTTLLKPKPDDVVLEIGSGSGYQAAILAKLVQKVVSIEYIKELCVFAQKNLSKAGIKNVSVVYADATEMNFGTEEYDKVIYTAASNKITNNIKRALKKGGLIVMPFGDLSMQSLHVYKKIGDRLKLVLKGPFVRFVPVRGRFGL